MMLSAHLPNKHARKKSLKQFVSISSIIIHEMPSSDGGGTVKDENKMKACWKPDECVMCEINVQAVLCSSVDRDSKV